MNEKLNTLNREIHRIRHFAFATIFGLIAALLLLLARNVFFSPVLLAASAWHILVVRRKMKAYQKHVQAATLEESLRPFLKEIRYTEKDGIPKEELAGCGLLPIAKNDRTLVRSTVHGNSQGRPACLSDVTFSYETLHMTRSGAEKPAMDFLSGCYFEIALSETVPHTFTLWAKELAGDYTRERFFDGQKLISAVQPPELRAGFQVYTEETDAFTLPADFTKAVLRLAEYTPGTLAVRVEEKRLQVFIQNRFLYTRTVPVRDDLTAQMLQVNQFPEITYLLRLADAI